MWRTELEGTPAAAVRGLGFFSPEMMREYDADIVGADSPLSLLSCCRLCVVVWVR